MSNPTGNIGVIVFRELLTHLRQEGFLIGVDEYLRLQAIINRLGYNCSKDDLRTLICPIIATNKEQQTRFYKAFDDYFKPSIPEKTKISPPQTRNRTFRYTFLTLLLLLIIGGISFFIEFPPKTGIIWNTNQSNSTPAAANNSSNRNNQITNVNAVNLEGKLTKQTNDSKEVEQQAQANISNSINTSLNSIPKTNYVEEQHTDTATLIRLSAVLIAIFLILLYQAYHLDKNRYERRQMAETHPPFKYRIDIKAPKPKIYNFERFYEVARLLRRRETGTFHRLNIQATIHATLQSLGYPNFRYKTDSKLPEYLVLIDRAGEQDHQALLFSELSHALSREEIYVSQYFFNGDPRLCYSPENHSFNLAELLNRHKEYKLLIFCDGEKLVDPLTSEIMPWTSIFAEWTDSFLLTPTHPEEWGTREISLSEQFVVLPATTEGLFAVAQYFETPLKTNLHHWLRDNTTLTPAFPEHVKGDMVGVLRNYLGKESFEWLCACAIHNELNWDLTIFLGSLPFMDKELLSERNLMRMVRLSWFRTGIMPDDLRRQLVQELDRNAEKSRAIRTAIVELVKRNAPPNKTFAANAYELFLTTHSWLLDKSSPGKLKELLFLIKKLPSVEVTRDAALTTSLEKIRKRRFERYLPDSVHKIIYRNGISGLGLRTQTLALVVLISASIVWIIAPFIFNRTTVSQIDTSEPVIIKTYDAMSDDEKRSFIAREAVKVGRVIGNQSNEEITPEAIESIKNSIDVYAARIRSPRFDSCDSDFVKSDLQTIIERGQKNAPFILSAFYAEGVDPRIGLYVAMIESEFCPCLQSPTGSLGMFQLGFNISSQYSLSTEVDASPSNPDDRCKPREASRAAAKYLKYLSGRFGTAGSMSFPLAIASYNSSQGSLSQNLEQALKTAAGQDSNFWALVANQVAFRGSAGEQFRRENVKYVPKFFAAAIVGENPSNFDLKSQPLSTYTVNLSTNQLATKTDAAKYEVPEEAEMQEMTRTALLDFNDAVRQGDFTDFHSKISKVWRKQTTPEKFNEVFSEFMTKKVNISEVGSNDAEFSPTPGVEMDKGARKLIAKGCYAVTPRPVKFVLKWIPEGKEWKLFGIEVDTTESTC